MIKRILVLVFICVLLLPAQALANDGGAKLDEDGFLKIKYDLSSTEIEIGEVFEFSVTLSNKTNYPIEILELNGVFDNTRTPSWNSEEFAEYDLNLEIDPGEQAALNLAIAVPEDIFWYKHDNKFYCDFNLGLVYFAYDEAEYGIPENEEQYYDLTWHYLNEELETVPLEILNLNDGKDLLELTLIERETKFYFPELQDHVSYLRDGKLRADIYNEIVLKNTSEYDITDVCIQNVVTDINDNEISPLSSNNTLSCTVSNVYYLKQRDIPEKLEAYYKTTFKIGDTYYCDEIIKEYDTEVLFCPKLNVSFNNLEYDSYEAVIENISDNDLENIYCYFPSDKILYKPEYQINLFEKNLSYTMQFQSSKEVTQYTLGYIRDGKLYFWVVDYPSYEVNINYYDYQQDFYYSIESIIPTPPVTDTPKPTASPKPTKTPSPTAPTIEITSVKKSSSIPIWVWIILPAAIVCAGLIVFLIRKKSKSEDE